MLNGSGRPFFALIIGIDTYQDTHIDNMLGCVADADDIQAFLTRDLHIAQDRIAILRNEKATYASIVQEIQKLAANDSVAFNDPILIYYAGCSRATQDGVALVLHDSATTDNSDWSSILVDTELNGLLKQLANRKGNNIVRWSIMGFFFSPNITLPRLWSLTQVMLRASVERAMHMRFRTHMFY